jgi:predicted RNase H-like HicB family nuclease
MRSVFKFLAGREPAPLQQRFTVEIIPDEEQGGFTARVPDISAYGEGDTADEAIADLKEALQAYVESFGLEDALARLMHG